MTPQEMNGAGLLLNTIEEGVGMVVELLRQMETNRRFYLHEGVDDVGRFVAALSIDNTMAEALRTTALLEQLLTKLRETLPKFEDENGIEFS